jgi:hypothetical protein
VGKKRGYKGKLFILTIFQAWSGEIPYKNLILVFWIFFSFLYPFRDFKRQKVPPFHLPVLFSPSSTETLFDVSQNYILYKTFCTKFMHFVQIYGLIQ